MSTIHKWVTALIAVIGAIAQGITAAQYHNATVASIIAGVTAFLVAISAWSASNGSTPVSTTTSSERG